MVRNYFPSMTEKYSIAYIGADIEQALVLHRPTAAGTADVNKISAQWIEVYSASAAAGASVQVFRSDTASTANQRDVTNDASVNVLIHDFYYDAASSVKRFELQNAADLDKVGLRIRLVNFGSTNHTVYVNVHYYYTQA